MGVPLVSLIMEKETEYKLLHADGHFYRSDTPGMFGGNCHSKVYGRLDCGAALSSLARGYAARRVFFADEASALANGYRPCGRCMPERYRV